MKPNISDRSQFMPNETLRENGEFRMPIPDDYCKAGANSSKLYFYATIPEQGSGNENVTISFECDRWGAPCIFFALEIDVLAKRLMRFSNP